MYIVDTRFFMKNSVDIYIYICLETRHMINIVDWAMISILNL